MAIEGVQGLHSSGKMQREIEAYATHQLQKLLQTKPIVIDDGKPF